MGRLHRDDLCQPKLLEASCQGAQLQADSSLPIGSQPDSRAAALQCPLLLEEGSLLKTRIAGLPGAAKHGEIIPDNNLDVVPEAF